MELSAQKTSLWSKNFIVLLICNITNSMGYQMLLPNMGKYVSSLGIPTATLGFVISIYSIAAIVSRPLMGKVTDLINKKYLLLTTLSGIAFAVFMYTIPQGVVGLSSVRIIHGLFFGANSIVAATIAANILPKEKYGMGFGIVGMGYSISQSVSPYLGIVLVENFGYTVMFLVAALAPAIACVIAVFFLSPQPVVRPEKKESSAPSLKKLARVLRLSNIMTTEAMAPAFIHGLSMSINSVVAAFILLLGDERGIKNLGIFFTVNAVVRFIVRPIIGRMSDTKPMNFTVYLSATSLVLSMLLIWSAHSIWVWLLASALWGFGSGGTLAVCQAEGLRRVHADRRGVASSTYYMFGDIGQAIGPAVGGIVASRFGYSSAMLVMIIPAMLGAAVMFISDAMMKAKAKKVNEAVSVEHS